MTVWRKLLKQDVKYRSVLALLLRRVCQYRPASRPLAGWGVAYRMVCGWLAGGNEGDVSDGESWPGSFEGDGPEWRQRAGRLEADETDRPPPCARWRDEIIVPQDSMADSPRYFPSGQKNTVRLELFASHILPWSAVGFHPMAAGGRGNYPCGRNRRIITG